MHGFFEKGNGSGGGGGKSRGVGKQKVWQDKAVPHLGREGCAVTLAGWTHGADALGP